MHGADTNILLPQVNMGKAFHGTDSLELYKASQLKKPASWPYHTKPVAYTWNRNGYRCKEWADVDWATSIVVMGCSMIAGIGLDDADTITSHMQDTLGMQVVNLGVPAGAADVLYYNSMRLADLNIRPRAVAVVAPAWARCTYFDQPQSWNLGPWYLHGMIEDAYLSTYYKYHTGRTPNAELHGYMSLRAIHSLWTSVGVACEVWEHTDMPPFIDTARDLQHPGIATAKTWASHLSTWVQSL